MAMGIRTTMFNTARAAVAERAEEYGRDLYQVSSHNAARPLCYPWQGKVISRSDWSGEVEDLNGNKVHVYAQSETSYGQAAGLFGVNCKHYPMTFIPGFSTLKGQPQDPEENEKAYAESQQQRRLERKLRAEKLDLETLKAQGADEDMIKAQRAKVRKASADIEDFCDATGRARRRNREYTPVDADFSGAKTPPYGVPVTNVTNEFNAKAKPNRGTVDHQNGFRAGNHTDEINIANLLHSLYGGNIMLMAERNPSGTKNPDYTWNGKLWELKTPEGIKGIDGLVHTGLKQIAPNSGGLIVDAKGLSGSHEEIMRQILHRVQRSAHDSLDLMVIEQDKRIRVYRYKKK